MYKIITAFVLGLVSVIGVYFYSNYTSEALGAFGDTFLSIQLAPNPSNGDCLTTDGTDNVWDTCAGGAGTVDGSGIAGLLTSWVDSNTLTSTSTPTFLAFNATGTATSTMVGSLNMTGSGAHLTTHGITANSSAGVHVHANNGTEVVMLGAGNTANASFYGGVNIDGATRFATSLTGLLKATAGAVTTAVSGTDYEVPVTAGDGLTRTVNDFDCDTANASTLGCLTASDWSTFNNKISSTSLSFTDSARIDGTYTSGTGVITADLVADSVSDTYLAFNTGQHLTTTSDVTFAEATTTQLSSSVLTVTNLSSLASTTLTASTTMQNATSTLTFYTPRFGINSEYFTDLTGTALSNTSGSLGITADAVGDTQLAFNTGQHLTTTSDVTFAEATTTQSFATVASSTSLFASTISIAGTVLSNVGATISAGLTAIIDFGSALSFEIPNGSAPTVDATGEIAIDTTSGQLKWFNGSATHIVTGTSSPAVNIASTTKDANAIMYTASATSTFLLKNSPEAITLNGWYCKASSTGAVNIRFGDGTNWTNMGYCTTAGNYFAATSNNTFTAWEDFRVQLGSATSSVPGMVTITTILNKTAD